MLFIVAIAIGGVIGTALDIDGRFRRLVDRKKTREGNNGDERGGRSLADGLSTAVLLYCIGPLSMLGPVISALKGDNTFLFTNATLDFVSSAVFASTYGFGMVLSGSPTMSPAKASSTVSFFCAMNAVGLENFIVLPCLTCL